MAVESDKCEKYGLHHEYADGKEVKKCFACQRDETSSVCFDCGTFGMFEKYHMDCRRIFCNACFEKRAKFKIYEDALKAATFEGCWTQEESEAMAELVNRAREL